MTEEERWEYLAELDEELLRGSVIPSEWCSVIVRAADIAFVHGAYLASILTAVSAIETHLRSESRTSRKLPLVELVQTADIDEDLREDLQSLRKYRNQWVHVESPWEDAALLENPPDADLEVERMAHLAARALRRTIFSNPWV